MKSWQPHDPKEERALLIEAWIIGAFLSLGIVGILFLLFF
jgi:hypothetical protein